MVHDYPLLDRGRCGLNVGSLFAGIGGFDLGLERAGMHTVWQVEQEPFRRAVLARQFPDAQRFKDVRDVGAHNLEWVDVICGGFPCQDLSLAGKGAGIDGARSGLWSEYARIVGELRPRYVIVENVPALLGRGMGRVLGDLAALGYDAEWDCLPASAFGAPHRRDRLWIVAYSTSARLERPGIQAGALPQSLGTSESTGDMAYPAGPRLEGRERSETTRRLRPNLAGGGEPGGEGFVADANGSGRGPREQDLPARQSDAEGSGDQDPDERALQPWRVGGRATQAGGPEWWAAEPPVGRVAHGVPDRLDQLAALGNARVPYAAEWIGARILSHEQAVQKAA
jgi:DNA (cytosine-5)-methyltransferase 1